MSLTVKGRLIVQPVRTALLSPWDWVLYFVDEHTRHWLQRPRFRSKGSQQHPESVREEVDKVQLHRLCVACGRVFGRSKLLHGSWRVWIKDSEVHQLHQSVGDLPKSVQKGCHFCTLISQYLLEEESANIPAGSDDSIWIEITTAFGNWGQNYSLYVHLGAKLSTGNVYQIRQARNPFEIFCGTPQVAPSLCYKNLGSEVHMLLAQYWLTMCIQYHPKCGKRNGQFVPTRLLDIGSIEQSDIRLCLCGPAQSGTPYLTLSHCWGGLQDILTLKSTNINILQDGIALDILPKSFRDAVSITRNLKVQYLWIDSLCILQDSPDDWAFEAGRMGSVFENSLCTIAASAATNSHSGCFANRNPLNFATCHVAGPSPDRKGMYLRKSNQKSDFIPCPLQSRAWVFQEAQLSPRTLSFGDSVISWACGLESAYEQDLYGRGYGYLQDETESNHGPLFGNHVWNAIWSADILRDYRFADHLVRRENDDADIDFHDWWFGQVKEYSERRLTVDTDKLITISGIAERVRQKTGRSYVAGIWEETIHEDLLWRVCGKLSPRPLKYRAPSWSWASVDGTILTVSTSLTSFELGHGIQQFSANKTVTILAHVENVGVNTLPSDPVKTGSVLDGSLQIAGNLKTIEADSMGYGADGYDPMQAAFADRKMLRFFPDCTEPVSECVLIPIKQITIKRKGDNMFECPFDLRIQGLVLTSNNDVYRRVGQFDMYSKLFDAGIVAWFKDGISQTVIIK